MSFFSLISVRPLLIDYGYDQFRFERKRLRSQYSKLCPTCEARFFKRGALEKLAISGFKFKRCNVKMIHAALDGCDFCKELLCLPYSCTCGPKGSINSCAHHWDREAKGGPVWPVAHWKMLLATHTGQKKFKFVFSPIIDFMSTVRSGLFQLSRETKMPGSMVRMLFHISVERSTSQLTHLSIEHLNNSQ
jgi:hypothetical protein